MKSTDRGLVTLAAETHSADGRAETHHEEIVVKEPLEIRVAGERVAFAALLRSVPSLLAQTQTRFARNTPTSKYVRITVARSS